MYKVSHHDLKATTPQVLEQILEAMDEEGFNLLSIVQVTDGVLWTIHSDRTQPKEAGTFQAID